MVTCASSPATWSADGLASGCVLSRPMITDASGPWQRVRNGTSLRIACMLAAAVARSNGA